MFLPGVDIYLINESTAGALVEVSKLHNIKLLFIHFFALIPACSRQNRRETETSRVGNDQP